MGNQLAHSVSVIQKNRHCIPKVVDAFILSPCGGEWSEFSSGNTLLSDKCNHCPNLDVSKVDLRCKY
jgi:hypothetical protein